MTALIRRETPTCDLYQEYKFYLEESYSLHPFFKGDESFGQNKCGVICRKIDAFCQVSKIHKTLLHAIVSSTSLRSKFSLIKRCFMIKNLMMENCSYFLTRVSFFHFFIPQQASLLLIEWHIIFDRKLQVSSNLPHFVIVFLYVLLQ